MQTKIKESLKNYPSLVKFYEKLTLRRFVQFAVVIIFLIAIWQFNNFIGYMRNDGIGDIPYKPPVAEGFLPIAALVAFKAMLSTGQIDPIHPAGLIIFIVTLATAWIFRRALCSWICPIGTLSEQLAKLGQKIMGGRNLKMPKLLDFTLLVIKFVLFFFIFKLFVTMTTEDAISFMGSPFYSISDIKMFDFFMNSGLKVIGVIGFLMLLSVFFKNFWCRYLCPYGALLGIIGFFSPHQLMKNNETCINCAKCNKACPNQVNVMDKKKIVASTECTGCAACVKACPVEGTIQMKLFGIVPVKPFIFSVAFIVVFFGAIFLAKVTGHWNSSVSIDEYRQLDKVMSSFGSGGGF